MTWGHHLKNGSHRLGALVVAALVLGGCQPSLNSQLPAGPAAYEVISDPADITPAAYFLRPGDKLAINIFQEEDLSQRELQIDEAGTISLPLIGDMQAAGLSPGQLSRAIETAYGRNYLRDPQANVVLLEARERTVSVEGEVKTAGVYKVQPGYTLLSALALAGSPTERAKLDEVLIVRTVNGERMGGRFDVTEVRAGRMPDPMIVPGDVVVVGFSRARSLYRDALQILPSVMGAFVTLTAYSNNNDNDNNTN
jgi:polysaccharide biosynthesis/export protein